MSLSDLIQVLKIIFGTSFALCLAKTKYPLLLDMESFLIILNWRAYKSMLKTFSFFLSYKEFLNKLWKRLDWWHQFLKVQNQKLKRKPNLFNPISLVIALRVTKMWFIDRQQIIFNILKNTCTLHPVLFRN